jgi:hypothetical protein
MSDLTPDQVLRQAQDELHTIDARIDQEQSNSRAAFDSPVRDRQAYLSAQLEIAHAHMVGERVARQALRDAFGRPRVRDTWRRAEAERLFSHVLSDFAWHRSAYRRQVESVEDWIRRFGRPGRPRPDLEAER